MQRFEHTLDVTMPSNVDVDDDDESIVKQVKIELDGYKADDYYATNLELTGQATWFGSLNMCDLLAAEHASLFKDGTTSILELGSGIGRAGVLAIKLLKMHRKSSSATTKPPGRLVLTDGEPSLVEILQQNCNLNGISDQVECLELKWGDNEQYQNLVKPSIPQFELVLGADLLYTDACENASHLFWTVNKLMKTGGRFYLAFTNRGSIQPEELLEIALEQQRLAGRIHPDYCYDIWDNNVDPESMFWRDVIYVFERVPPANDEMQVDANADPTDTMRVSNGASEEAGGCVARKT